MSSLVVARRGCITLGWLSPCNRLHCFLDGWVIEVVVEVLYWGRPAGSLPMS